MDKIITVYNKELGEVGHKWRDIIFSFYDDSNPSPETVLRPVIVWLSSQDQATLKSIAHVLVDVNTKTINMFFKSEKKPLSGGTIPRGYKIEIFENFPYGADTTGKLWRSYYRDYWTETKPLDWGEHKDIWRDFKRKDIWG